MKRDSPLPNGWEVGYDHDGKPFYIDHNEEKTTWVDPRERNARPSNAGDCSDSELPYGWEEAFDPQIGVYYIDHIRETNQLEDPRIKWKEKQENMILNYVHCAHEDLNTKNALLHAKSERLQLAQEEVLTLQNLLTSRGVEWKASDLSLASIGSIQHQPRAHNNHDQLRDELDLARSRVAQLQTEMNTLQAVVASKERGLARLDNLAATFAQQEPLSVEGAKSMLARISTLHSSLARGEKERNWLISELSHLCVKNSNNGVVGGPAERMRHDLVSSMADSFGLLRPKLINGVDGSRLAQLAKLRLEMNETRQIVESLQLQLAQVEASIVPALEDADESKVLLLVEKKKLLHDLQERLRQQPIDPSSADAPRLHALEEEVQHLCEEVQAKDKSLNQRLLRQRTKWLLRQRLLESVQRLTNLESAVKDLSASTTTLASSAGSSSLSSLASSIGSLNSVSMVDIYRSTGGAPVTSSINGANFGASGGGGPCLNEPLAMSNSVNQLNTILEAMSFSGSQSSTVATAPTNNHIDPKSASGATGTQACWDTAQQRRAYNRHYVNLKDGSSADGNAGTVSSAVSNESVAGDSGVFEGRLDSAVQVYLRLEYNPTAEELLVCVERAHNPPSSPTPPDSELALRLGLESSPGSTVATAWYSLAAAKPCLDLNEVMHVPLAADQLRHTRLQVSGLVRPPERQIGTCQVGLCELAAGRQVCSHWYSLGPIRPPAPGQAGDDVNGGRHRVVVPHGSLSSRVLPYVVAEPAAEAGVAPRPTSLALSATSPEATEAPEAGVSAPVAVSVAQNQQSPSKFYSPVYCTNSEVVGMSRSQTYTDSRILQCPQMTSPKDSNAPTSNVNVICSRAIRLNRSESDSMVPLRRQATSPFTRLAQDRRSVRLPTARGTSRNPFNRSTMVDRSRPNIMLSRGYPSPLRPGPNSTAIVDRARSVTSLDLMLDLEASELRHTEQRQELESLRQLHTIVREQGCNPDAIHRWMDDHDVLARRIARRSQQRSQSVVGTSVDENMVTEGTNEWRYAHPHAQAKTHLQDRRMRRIMKTVERRVRDLQRGASFDIPLSQKLDFFVARAAAEVEEEEEEEEEREESPEQKQDSKEPTDASRTTVRGICLPLVAVNEPTDL